MFDRFILASDLTRIQKQLGIAKLVCQNPYTPSYNIGYDDTSFVISNYQTKELEQFKFGLKVGNETNYFVRAEGKRNMNDDPQYSGSNAIFLIPEYSRIIRSQRCLVLADAFVVGIKDNAPHLIYMRNKQRPFAFAGIWNKTINEETGDSIYSFAIITTTTNSLLAQLGYKRMPIILNYRSFNSWINPSTSLSKILSMLHPYSANSMNTYPISTRIIDRTVNEKLLVSPLRFSVNKDPIEINSVKSARRNKFSQADKQTLGERINISN